MPNVFKEPLKYLNFLITIDMIMNLVGLILLCAIYISLYDRANRVRPVANIVPDVWRLFRERQRKNEWDYLMSGGLAVRDVAGAAAADQQNPYFPIANSNARPNAANPANNTLLNPAGVTVIPAAAGVAAVAAVPAVPAVPVGGGGIMGFIAGAIPGVGGFFGPGAPAVPGAPGAPAVPAVARVDFEVLPCPNVATTETALNVQTVAQVTAQNNAVNGPAIAAGLANVPAAANLGGAGTGLEQRTFYAMMAPWGNATIPDEPPLPDPATALNSVLNINNVPAEITRMYNDPAKNRWVPLLDNNEGINTVNDAINYFFEASRPDLGTMMRILCDGGKGGTMYPCNNAATGYKGGGTNRSQMPPAVGNQPGNITKTTFEETLKNYVTPVAVTDIATDATAGESLNVGAAGVTTPAGSTVPAVPTLAGGGAVPGLQCFRFNDGGGNAIANYGGATSYATDTGAAAVGAVKSWLLPGAGGDVPLWCSVFAHFLFYIVPVFAYIYGIMMGGAFIFAWAVYHKMSNKSKVLLTVTMVFYLLRGIVSFILLCMLFFSQDLMTSVSKNLYPVVVNKSFFGYFVSNLITLVLGMACIVTQTT